MDEHLNMATAARHRDWQGCARVMFRQLFLYPAEAQQKIAADILSEYIGVWNAKHPNETAIPQWTPGHTQPALPEFDGDLDPADAEFENALIEFYNGTSRTADQMQRTMHFAGAIRSTVLASQINRWLHDFPDEYRRWKEGLMTTGPTFLDDEAAANEAERMWLRVDGLLAKQRVADSGLSETRLIRSTDIAKAYDDWEKSLL